MTGPCRRRSCRVFPQQQKELQKHAKAIVAKDIIQLAPKTKDLISMVNPDLEGDKFVRIFMLIVLPIFVFPTSLFRINHHYYETIHIVRKIKLTKISTLVLLF